MLRRGFGRNSIQRRSPSLHYRSQVVIFDSWNMSVHRLSRVALYHSNWGGGLRLIQANRQTKRPPQTRREMNERRQAYMRTDRARDADALRDDDELKEYLFSCPSVCLLVYDYIHIRLHSLSHLSIRLNILPSIHISICPAIHPSILPSIIHFCFCAFIPSFVPPSLWAYIHP